METRSFVIVGIDGSNLRDGGGITHLREFLSHAQPSHFGIDRFVVWCGPKTASALPERAWLTVVAIPQLDRSTAARFWFQWQTLWRLARAAQCAVVYAPGGLVLRT